MLVVTSLSSIFCVFVEITWEVGPAPPSGCTSSYCRGDAGTDLVDNQDFYHPLAAKGQQRPSATKNK